MVHPLCPPPGHCDVALRTAPGDSWRHCPHTHREAAGAVGSRKGIISVSITVGNRKVIISVSITAVGNRKGITSVSIAAVGSRKVIISVSITAVGK